MKKLPIIIMLSAAGITGVAMAQTSSSASDTSGYGKTSSSSSMNGASGTTGYGTSSQGGTDGAASPSGYVKDSASGPGAPAAVTSTSGNAPPEGYGKKVPRSKSTTAPSAPGMTSDGSGTSMTSSGGITWTCPSGYTLSTATRDGTPLCYPNSGPMPGR